MAAQHVLGGVWGKSKAKKKKRTVIRRASKYLVSQILLLPWRTPVLLSYCNLSEESRNSQPRNLLLSAKTAQLFGPQPNDSQSFWNYLWYLVSLIHEVTLGALYDINFVPLSWTCLNFPKERRLFQKGWTLFIPWLPHSVIFPPSWSAQASVSSLPTTLLSLRNPSWSSLLPVIPGWWPFTKSPASSLHQLGLSPPGYQGFSSQWYHSKCH